MANNSFVSSLSARAVTPVLLGSPSNDSPFFRYAVEDGVLQVGNHTITLTTLGNARTSTLFTALLADGTPLVPGNTTTLALDTRQTTIAMEYPLFRGNSPYANVTVSVNLSSGNDTIVAHLTPLVGDIHAYRIAWLAFTNLGTIDNTWNLKSPSVPFEAIDSPDFSNYGSTLAIGNVTLNGITLDDHVSLGGGQIVLDYTDAAQSVVGTFATSNRLSLDGFQGNSVAVLFAAGTDVIDPALLSHSTPYAYNGYSVQQKVLYDGQRYWAFWGDQGSTYVVYSSSPDGRTWTTPVSGIPSQTAGTALKAGSNLPFSFTVVNNGRAINILYADSAETHIYMASGVADDQSGVIDWNSAVDLLYTAPNVLEAPPLGTYTANGILAITFTETQSSPIEDVVSYLALDCANLMCNNVGTGSGQTRENYFVLAPTAQYPYAIQLAVPADLRGTPDELMVVYSSSVGNNAYFGDIGFYDSFTSAPATYSSGNLLEACADSNSNDVGTIYNVGGSDSARNLTSLVPISNSFLLTYANDPTGGYQVDSVFLNPSTCKGGAIDVDFEPGSVNSVNNVATSTEADGTAVDVFWIASTGSPATVLLYFARITSGAVILTEGIPWAASYQIPSSLSVAYSSARFVALMFMVGGSQYFASYPSAIDFVGPNNPWVQLPGGPVIQDQGGSINPGTGFLQFSQNLVATPGRTSAPALLSIQYSEPGLFYYNGADAYSVLRDNSPDAFTYTPPRGVYERYDYVYKSLIDLSLPWIDIYQGRLHLGGLTYDIVWNSAGSGSTMWFNNTAGTPFELKSVFNGGYYLYLSYGLAAVFDNGGAILTYYSDSTGQNGLNFNYNTDYGSGTIFLSSVTSIGVNLPGTARAIGIGVDTTTTIGRVTSMSYEAGKVISFAYGDYTHAGIPDPSGTRACPDTDSRAGTVTITDAVGRATTYYVCYNLLTRVDLPDGGRINYTYWQDNQGSDLYSYHVSKYTVFNDSTNNVIARQVVFYPLLVNGEITQMLTVTYDGAGRRQGTNIYQFQGKRGMTSVTTLDESGRSLWYDMQSTSTCGTNTCMTDLSGNNNNGVMPSSGTNPSPGRFVQGTNFGGTSNIVASSSASLNPAAAITIVSWFNMPSISTYWAIGKWVTNFGSCGPTHCSYFLSPSYGSNNYPTAFFWNGASNAGIAATSVLPTNTWDFVATTFDHGKMALYINDGTHLANPYTAQSATVTTLNPASTDPFAVGGITGTFYYKGYIDEVRVYARALSPDEILSLYQQNQIVTGTTRTWWNSNGQPTVIDRFDGLSTTPTTTTTALDNWGNVMYTRDAAGNERFSSFANASSENRFVAPARLDQTTSGLVWEDNFDAYSVGFYPTANSGNAPTVVLDNSNFASYGPSLKYTPSTALVTDDATASGTIPSGYNLHTQFKIYLSSTSSNFYVQLTSPLTSTYYPGIQFVNGRIYGPDGIQCTGSAATYQADTWYAVNLEYITSASTVYDFVDAAYCGHSTTAVLGTGPSNLITMHLVAPSNGPKGFTAWIDEVLLTTESSSSGNGITINGLQPGQVAELDDASGNYVSSVEEPNSGGAVVLNGNWGQNALPASLIPGFWFDIGSSIIRIYGVDGTLEYTSASRAFYRGDVYTYVPPRTFEDALAKTKSGALSWSKMLLDESGNIGTLTCAYLGNPFTCPSSVWTGAVSLYTATSGAQTSHLSDFTATPYAQYVSTSSSIDSAFTGDFYQQYMYIPAAAVGSSVPTVPHQAAIDLQLNGPTNGGSWVEASWGDPFNANWASGSSVPGNVVSVKQMSSAPFFTTGRWVKLLVRASDIIPYGDTIEGIGAEISNGEVYWDAASRVGMFADAVTIFQLPGSSSNNYWAGLYWASNNTLITSGYTNGVSITLDMYPKVSIFPVLARIVIGTCGSSCSQPVTPVYQGAPTVLWGGEQFTYESTTGFYHQAIPSSYQYVHDVPIGGFAPSNDNFCKTAALCYDMESMGPGESIQPGSGTVPVVMYDQSSSHSDGTVVLNGVNDAAPLVFGASGLALNFDGTGSNYIAAGTTGAVSISAPALTLSAWVKPAATVTQGIVINKENSYEMALNNGVFQVAVQNAGAGTWAWGGTAHISNGVWTLLTFVYDGSRPLNQMWSFYVNGALYQQMAPQGSAPQNGGNVATSSYPLQVGLRSSGFPFDGAIDSVLIYGTAWDGPHVMGFFKSTLPNDVVSYAELNTAVLGTIAATHTIWKGGFSERTFSYDVYGNLVQTTFNTNSTSMAYSPIDNGMYETQILRPDGNYILSSYDIFTGNQLGGLTTDCHRTRTVYNAADQPTQTAYFDTDPTMMLYLDMETTLVTGSTWSFADVSCHSRLGQATSTGFSSTSVAYGPTGLAGMAAAFDGSTSKITVPDIAIGNPMTLAAWVNPSSGTTGEMDIVSRDATGQGGYKLIYESGKVWAYFNMAVPITGSNYPTGSTGTASDCGGTDGGDWANPANADAAGGGVATAAPGAGVIYCSEWNTFGYTIPSTARVTSVQVVASYDLTGTSRNLYALNVGLLTGDGSTVCPVQQDTSQPVVLTQKTFAFTSCKSWTPTDFNSNNIRVDVGADRGSGGGPAQSFNLDYVELVVGWTQYQWEATTGYQIPVGSWSHVAVVSSTSGSNSVVTTYINGVPESPADTLAGVPNPGPSATVSVGADVYANNYYFGGKLDEVAILDAALNQTNVKGLMLGTYDQMTSVSSAYDYSPFPSTTTDSADSIPRSLYYDMSTLKPGPLQGVAPSYTYTFEDLSGNGNNGLGYNVATCACGEVGNGQFFDGTNSYTTAASSSSLSPTLGVTVAFWGYWTSLPNNYSTPIITKSAGASSYAGPFWFELYSSGNLAFYVGTADGQNNAAVISATPIHQGHEFVGTYDGNTISIYEDGSFVSSYTHPGALRVSSGAFTIGKGYGTAGAGYGTWYFDGAVDEVQVIPQALTAAQVKALYNGYKGGSAGFDPTHYARNYFDGLGRPVRQVIGDLYGNGTGLTTAESLGWDDNAFVGYQGTGSNEVSSTTAYDFLGRPVVETTPGPTTVMGVNSIAYENTQRTAIMTDPVGRQSETVVDALGRITVQGVGNPAANNWNTTVITYNAGTQISSESIQLGGAPQWTFTYYYNVQGLLTLELDPNGNVVSNISYDNDFRPYAVEDNLGHVAVYAYDSMGRTATMTLRATPSASPCSGCTTTYTYNVTSDELLSVSNGTADDVYTYDGLHRLKTETINMPASNPTSVLTTQYSYDSASRVTTLKYPQSQGSVGYAYDTLGRPVQVTFNGTAYAQLVYDSRGRLVNVTYPQSGNYYQAFTYDVRSRETQVVLCPPTGPSGGCVVWLGGYNYNAASQLTSITNDNMGVGTSGRSSTLTYDANGRLVAAFGPFSSKPLVNNDNQNAWLNYSYDGLGFMTKRQDSDLGSCTSSCLWNGAQTVSYAYGSAYDQVGTSLGPGSSTETFGYNPDGSMTSRSSTGTTFGYDFSQQLTSVSSGGTTYTYYYDALGRRVMEVSGSATTHYAYVGSHLSYAANGGSTSVYAYAAGAVIFRKDSGSTVHYYLSDPTGNVRLVWSYSSGITAEAKYRYKPFGQQATPLVSMGANPRFKYANAEADPTGLVHMGARYYVPDLARFLSRDPKATHGYEYAFDNPLGFRDPSGLDAIDWAGLGAFIAGAVVMGACIALTAGVCGGVIVAIALAAAAGAATAVVITAAQGQPITLNTVVGGAFMGALGGATVFGLAGAGVFGPEAASATLGSSETIGAGVAGGEGVGAGLGGAAGEDEGITGDVGAEPAPEAPPGASPISNANGAGASTETQIDQSLEPTRGGIDPVIKGQEGENAAGITGPKTRIPSLTDTAEYRVPDYLDENTLREVKNVERLSMSSQLLDFLLYTRENDLEFQLVVGPQTQISQGLLYDLIMSGEVKLMVLP